MDQRPVADTAVRRHFQTDANKDGADWCKPVKSIGGAYPCLPGKVRARLPGLRLNCLSAVRVFSDFAVASESAFGHNEGANHELHAPTR